VSTEKRAKTVEERRSARLARPSVPLRGLKACRIAAGLTQRELAELVGTNQTTIADLERWEDRVDPELLGRLRLALGVTLLDLNRASAVTDAEVLGGRGGNSAEAPDDEVLERRRQVNRIKKKGLYGGGPGTVFLRGLKGCRVAAGFSQRRLASMIGTNQATISQLEKGYGSRGAYMSTVRKLCQALDVSPADLIRGKPVE
jgi:transcriptional regulator with XRE-family HTH domain